MNAEEREARERAAATLRNELRTRAEREGTKFSASEALDVMQLFVDDPRFAGHNARGCAGMNRVRSRSPHENVTIPARAGTARTQ